MLDNRPWSIVSIYRPPNVYVSPRQYDQIFSSIKPYCVIAEDFNAHHTLWGGTKNDRHGLSLIEALDGYPNLVVRNEGHQTRLNAPDNNQSSVDISYILQYRK